MNNNMQEKLLICINMKMPLYNVFELRLQQSLGSPLFSIFST
jgi:hypothetical protein